MSNFMDYIYLTMMFIGLAFVLIAAIGLVKFNDIYTRLHAASKGVTFGFCFLILGATLLGKGDSMDMAKALLAITFQFLTAPIAAHMIARVALRKGIKPIKNPEREYHEYYNSK